MRPPNSRRLLAVAALAAALSLVACGPPSAYAGGGNGNGNQGNTSTADSGSDGGTPDGGTADAGQVDPACQPGAWSSIALPFFDNYCTGCHPYFSNLSTVQQQAGTISSYIQSQMMPPSYRQQPTDADRQTILRWLACGAPQ